MAATSGPERAWRFLFLLVCGLAVFTLSMTFSPAMPDRVEGAVRAGLCVAFLVATVAAFQFPRWKRYWPFFFACFTAAFSLFMASRLSDYGLRIFSLTTETPPGIAVAKLSEAVLIVFFIILLSVAARSDRASIYLGRGNLKKGLAVGLTAFAACAIAAVVQALGQKVEPARLVSWAPWILIFVLANGYMEELLFRGIFLRRLDALVGTWPANLLTALVFALAHARVSYTPDVAVFVGITLVLGLVWGYIIQKTDSLIASWLFHAGADVLIIVGVFASL